MFSLYLIITLFIILLFLYLFIKIILDKKMTIANRGINVGVYCVLITTIIAIILNIVMFVKTKDYPGAIGDRGIQGSQGKHGKKGICDSRCGQKVCYVTISEEIDTIFQNVITKYNSDTDLDAIKKYKVLNKDFLDKINKICGSEEYMDILTQNRKNTPTEKILIDFIQNLVHDWIKIIVTKTKQMGSTKYDTEGTLFLQNPNLKLDYISSINLYNESGGSVKTETDTTLKEELEKYDVWNWNSPKNNKRLLIDIQSENIQLPQPDTSQLYIQKTNNYRELYNSDIKKDIWDDKYCPHNQMGINKDNPNNLKKCISINKANYVKEYINTWKNETYNKNEDLTLYNTNEITNKHKQNFYPVGSVWRGKVDPNSNPDKETIVVSGDVKDPVDFKQLWDSNIGCPECQNKHIKIFRPIPPKDYTCLGDVAAKDKTEAKGLNIKCVPSKCVKKKNLGSKIWNNSNVNHKTYNDYLSYTKRAPHKVSKQLSASIWSAGLNNAGEEYNNRYGTKLEDDGGYNLFRLGKGHDLKPDEDTYVIKNECLQPGNGKKPKQIDINLHGIVKQQIEDTANFKDYHKTDKYFGDKNKPPYAIIENIQDFSNETDKNITNSHNINKKYYLIDDNNKRYDDSITDGSQDNLPKNDTYFIKTFNEKKNDFSNCLVTNSGGNVYTSPYCDKTNPYHQWSVKYINTDSADADADSDSNVPVNKKKLHIVSNVKSESETGKPQCLKQYYDKNGNDINELKDCDFTDIGNWLYQTFTTTKLPNNFRT